MSREKKDFIAGIFFACLSIAYLVGSVSIASYSGAFGSGNSFGSAVIPRVVGTFVLVLSILLILSSQKRKLQLNKNKGKSESEEISGEDLFSAAQTEEEKMNSSSEKVDKKSTVLSVVFLCIYTLLLEDVGFIVMTSVYMIAQMLLLTKPEKRKRTAPLIVILSIVFSFAVYALFVKGFSLLLPPGVLVGIFD